MMRMSHERHMTEKVDQLNRKMALATLVQDSADAPDTTLGTA